jgi:hypothetical protein
MLIPLLAALAAVTPASATPPPPPAESSAAAEPTIREVIALCDRALVEMMHGKDAAAVVADGTKAMPPATAHQVGQVCAVYLSGAISLAKHAAEEAAIADAARRTI